jgi:hypothetical protein
MTTTFGPMTASDVDSADALIEFAQRRLGVPFPTMKDRLALKKQAKWFLEHNPTATWHTLAKVVEWAHAKKRRPAAVYSIVTMAKYAWSDGWLPELDAKEDTSYEDGIIAALQVETDPEWRHKLMSGYGSVRAERYQEWLRCRA